VLPDCFWNRWGQRCRPNPGGGLRVILRRCTPWFPSGTARGARVLPLWGSARGRLLGSGAMPGGKLGACVAVSPCRGSPHQGGTGSGRTHRSSAVTPATQPTARFRWWPRCPGCSRGLVACIWVSLVPCFPLWVASREPARGTWGSTHRAEQLHGRALVACGSQLPGESGQAKPCRHSPGQLPLCAEGGVPPRLEGLSTLPSRHSDRVGHELLVSLYFYSSLTAGVVSSLLDAVKGLLLGFGRQG